MLSASESADRCSSATIWFRIWNKLIVATAAANLFYLTMTFYYFYAFVALAVALPVVFARRR